MIALFLLFAIPLILIFLTSKYKKPALHPPGPRGLPFIGNLHQYEPNNPHLHLWKLSQKYGPIISMKLGSVQTLVISSPKIAKQVFKTQDNIFASRPTLKTQQKLSYNGTDIAFSPPNGYWREVRKLCVLHLFSSKQVQSFGPIRKDEVLRLKSDMLKRASEGVAVNLKERVIFLTCSLINRVAFGKRYSEEGLERLRFDKLSHETEMMLVAFFFSDYLPLLGWIDKLTGKISQLEKNFVELDSFYQELIEEHLSPNRPESTEQDILDILLRLHKEKSSSSLDLTMENIKGILMNIFIGGTDTSAATIVWAMTSLIKEPRIMEKVQAEIRSSVGNRGFVDEEDIQKLSYLKAVIKETLRLYPPAPLLLPRETTEKCVLNGYEIQPKTLVIVNAWAIARDPEFWENPDEFLPERFLESAIDFKGQDFGFIPFGSGRRICPGMSMGVATVELVLANLLYSFDWKLPPGMEKEDIDLDCIPGITMHKKNPLFLVPKEFHI